MTLIHVSPHAQEERRAGTEAVADGRPNADRSWKECFAQLVGTILSLWDAAELDAVGQDGEVAPRFINLADASIKMVFAPIIPLPR